MKTKKTKLELAQLNTAGTVFNVNFDFTNAEQAAILQELIQAGFTLYGFKAAGGAGQIASGVPVWFTRDYKNIFGMLNINYTPKFKVYIGNSIKVGPDTIITSDKMSPEVPLGTAVTVDRFGNFSTVPGGAPDGTIELINDRPADTDMLTVGLAALVDGEFRPFCAFESRPGSTISMEPRENVLLFAAQTNLVSGSVVANTAAPGCLFPLDSAHIQYSLEMIPGTLGMRSVSGGLPVTPTVSQENIGILLGN